MLFSAFTRCSVEVTMGAPDTWLAKKSQQKKTWETKSFFIAPNSRHDWCTESDSSKYVTLATTARIERKYARYSVASLLTNPSVALKIN